MTYPRRHFLQLVSAVAATVGLSRSSSAQGFPSRPVRMVVPFVAGGPVDVVARLLANRLTEIWNQPVVVENRGGAGGNIGTQAVVQAAPDGHSLLVGSVFLATNPFLYTALGYDPVAQLTPVALIGVFPNLMVTPKSLPAKSVREFIDYARSNPGKLSFGSSGTGTSVHLSGELFKRMAGIEMTHVPYRGGAPAINDLIPGRVHAYFGNLPAMLPHVQSNQLQGLAVTSATRSPLAPDIATIAESGLPGFDVSAWYGVFLPAKTSDEIVMRVHRDVVAAITHPPVTLGLEKIGTTVTPSTPAELAGYLKFEMAKWGPIIKELGIKAG